MHKVLHQLDLTKYVALSHFSVPKNYLLLLVENFLPSFSAFSGTLLFKDRTSALILFVSDFPTYILSICFLLGGITLFFQNF